MENDSLSCRLSTIQPIIVKYLKEKEQIKQQIIKRGIVPKELCKRCEGQGSKRWIVPFSEQEQKEIRKFAKWLKENKVKFVERPYFKSQVTVKGTQPIGKKHPISFEKGIYEFQFRNPEFEKKAFITDPKALNRLQPEIKSCKHFNPEIDKIYHLVREERFGILRTERYTRELRHRLFLACKECKNEIDNRECDIGARKIGFTYSVSCDLDGLLLRKVLEEAELPFETGEIDERFIFPRQHGMFFLRKHEILIAKELDEATVSQLNPKLIVCFGDKSKIVEYLRLNTNILMVTDDGEFYLYDHAKPFEESIDRVVNAIVEKLDDYAEEIRGNEHDRVVKAFEKIG